MTVMTPLEDEVRALVSAQITRVAERSFNPERSRAESVSKSVDWSSSTFRWQSTGHSSI